MEKVLNNLTGAYDLLDIYDNGAGRITLVRRILEGCIDDLREEIKKGVADEGV